jgi:hypothetical protein
MTDKELAAILESITTGLNDVDVAFFQENIYNKLRDSTIEPELQTAIMDLHRAARNAVQDLDQKDY